MDSWVKPGKRIFIMAEKVKDDQPGTIAVDPETQLFARIKDSQEEIFVEFDYEQKGRWVPYNDKVRRLS